MTDIQKTRLKGPFAKRKQLEIDKADLSQEMYKRNLELAESNQALSLLRTIDKLVLESHEELDVLCQNVSKAIIDHSTYPFVAILANPPHKDFIELFGWATSFADQPELTRYRVELDDHDIWLVSPDKSITLELKNISNETIARVLHDRVDDVVALRHAMPIQSVVFVKLLARHRLVGLMVIGFTQDASAIAEKERLLLDRQVKLSV